jgi:hypothetical protein
VLVDAERLIVEEGRDLQQTNVVGDCGGKLEVFWKKILGDQREFKSLRDLHLAISLGCAASCQAQKLGAECSCPKR